MAGGLKGWLAEARRRRVFRTAGIYLLAVWGASQGIAELGPLFGGGARAVEEVVQRGLQPRDLEPDLADRP